MAQQIIDNGSFDNDPGAEKIRLAFGKTNDNFTELYNRSIATGKAAERTVAFVDSGSSELAKVASSINAAPQIVIPNGLSQYISIIFPYSGNVGTIGNYNYQKRLYRLKKGAGTYGQGGTSITYSDLIKVSVYDEAPDAEMIYELGDIGTEDVWDYVNDNGNYVITGVTFFTAIQDGDDKIWVFSGSNGTYGSGQLQTTELNFIDLSLQNIEDFNTVVHNLSLIGINTSGDELTYIGVAVAQKGAFTCEPGQQMVFKTTMATGGTVIDPVYTVSTRYYRLKRNLTSIGGGVAIAIPASYFMPDGQGISIFAEDDDNIIVELGDIGTTDVEDAFNDGDGGDPWDMSVKRFIRATYDGDVTLWSWQGSDGDFGGSGTPATADDFFLITGQPITTIETNNIVTLKTVLDSDLDTVDADGLATYYNELDPAVIKNGYESWRINIVDGTDAILKTFDLVDRGKGLIGSTSDLPELEASNFFEINVGGSIQGITGDNDNVDNTDPNNPIVLSKPLVTPDTGTEITLYPFGNFCNSFVANLEEDTFTFALTNEGSPAGETATVLIKTDVGASDFPVLTDAEYVEGAPFEADAYFDLYAWNNGAITAYTFLTRSEPPPWVIIPEVIGDVNSNNPPTTYDSPSSWKAQVPTLYTFRKGEFDVILPYGAAHSIWFGSLTLEDHPEITKYSLSFVLDDLPASWYMSIRANGNGSETGVNADYRIELTNTNSKLYQPFATLRDTVSAAVEGDKIEILVETGKISLFINDVLVADHSDVSITFSKLASSFSNVTNGVKVTDIKQRMYID